MTIPQALVLGLLQGVTELFPVSSLGHSVLLPAIFRWPLDEHDPSFLVFLVATHLATALVLFFFYWREWMQIFGGMWRTFIARNIDEREAEGKLGWLLVVATVPAGILGILFEKPLQQLFATPTYAAAFLSLNGALLFGAERLRRRVVTKDARLGALSWASAIFIGCMQSLALLPGFSRTGATLAGGLLSGVSHEDAARFAFLLATPIIAAAAVLKLPELLTDARPDVAAIATGSAAAAAAAYLSVRYLTRYFRSHTLMPFAFYCALAGLVCLGLLR